MRELYAPDAISDNINSPCFLQSLHHVVINVDKLHSAFCSAVRALDGRMLLHPQVLLFRKQGHVEATDKPLPAPPNDLCHSVFPDQYRRYNAL